MADSPIRIGVPPISIGAPPKLIGGRRWLLGRRRTFSACLQTPWPSPEISWPGANGFRRAAKTLRRLSNALRRLPGIRGRAATDLAGTATPCGEPPNELQAAATVIGKRRSLCRTDGWTFARRQSLSARAGRPCPSRQWESRRGDGKRRGRASARPLERSTNERLQQEPEARAEPAQRPRHRRSCHRQPSSCGRPSHRRLSDGGRGTAAG